MENCQSEARMIARGLHERYDPLRAVTLIGQCMTKALFAAKPDIVMFWAQVHLCYRDGADIDASKQRRVSDRE